LKNKPKKNQRRLLAILSADVVGYSRLMGDDESATVASIKRCRKLFANGIKKHVGKMIDAKGDNLLAKFTSVVDAIECAVKVQNRLTDMNTSLPDHRRMAFRIGVNLGDVIEEGGTIYGDGVNIAARLESMADPGGICISRSAHDQVVGKLDLNFEYLGEHQVKNIGRPVRAYRVVLRTDTGADQNRNPSTLSDKPSIAVLPFDNLSGDPAQEYFSDGMTEEIISGLSKIPRLRVIARNSTFTYKGKPVKTQEVGRELGVAYVLEGSVRKSGNKVRITAQLAEAETGHHLWSERWDREMEDIFALQDEITMKIMTALQVKLTEGEQARIWEEKDRPTNLEAYELVLQGEEYFSQLTEEGNILARQKFDEALKHDPEYASAYVLKAWTYQMDAWMDWSKDPMGSFMKAAELAEHALSLNDALDTTQALMGIIYLNQRQYDKAEAAVERAVSLNPSGADVYAWKASVLTACGRHADALEASQRAIRLNPLPPSWYYLQLGRINCFCGNYREALKHLEKAAELLPASGPLAFNLTIAHSLAGNLEEAKAAAAELLKWYPDFALDRLAEMMPFKNPDDVNMILKAFRRAGLS
jgi:adenylate cyclase